MDSPKVRPTFTPFRIGVPTLALVHVASWTGQRLGRHQMVELKEIVDDMLAHLED
jgi:hypothetical protein